MDRSTFSSFGHGSAVVVRAIMIVTLICALFIVGFGFWASSQIDGQAKATQEGFARRGFADVVAKLERDEISMTTWDAAVTSVRANDQDFITKNLGVWAGEFFGLDEVYILTPDNRPIYAMQNGKDVAPAAFDGARPISEPLVTLLRQKMAKASKDTVDSTAAVGGLGAVDTITIRGMPAIISVKPIVPSSTDISQAPGNEHLYIAIQYLDPPLVASIAEQYALKNAHLAASPGPQFWTEYVPLASANGSAHWYLVWDSNRPALALLTQTGPVLAGGGLIGALLLILLGRRLTRATTELQASEANSQYLAFHDVLTGLPNRALFDDRLEQGLAKMRRDQKRLALLFLDLDQFKNVNDTLGHPAGDELIRQVAARLRAILRDADTVARFGGDEFAIIQLDIGDESEVESLCQRIVDNMEAPFDLMGAPAFIGVSIGITMSFATAIDRTEMLRKADIALYEAKANGRGGYRMFAGDMDEIVLQRRQIETDLRAAIDTRTQIRLDYQPLFAPDGVTIVGAEALARWDHPVHGTLAPSRFIGLAEERGLINTLGEWLLRDACRFASKTSIPWVAVNVSPVQFRNENFATLVKSILDECLLPPSKLQLEITEGMLITNPRVTEATLKKLRTYGIRVAVDDFGTGYSSMSYLRRYTVDKLKIDRSFVQQLGASEDSDELIRAMVGLARAMHMEVTAEGVETPEQRRHLAEIGCHELQGFLMSKPISGHQLQQLIAAPSAVDKKLVA